VASPRGKAPTLILHGARDHTVPITEAYWLYHFLRDNGVETKLIVYPSMGHTPYDPVHIRDMERRWAGWIEEHLAVAE
jgi:dipeptidyl aminopeptidase/acylaminoacyl peptidase